MEQAQFQHIGEYLKSLDNPIQRNLSAMLVANLGFFRKLEKTFLIGHRHDNPQLQQEYDQQFGLVVKK